MVLVQKAAQMFSAPDFDQTKIIMITKKHPFTSHYVLTRVFFLNSLLRIYSKFFCFSLHVWLIITAWILRLFSAGRCSVAPPQSHVFPWNKCVNRCNSVPRKSITYLYKQYYKNHIKPSRLLSRLFDQLKLCCQVFSAMFPNWSIYNICDYNLSYPTMNESFHLDASLEFKRPKIDAPGMVPWNGMEFKRQNWIDSPSPKKLR